MESLTASNNANFLFKNSLALDFQWKYPWLGQLPTKMMQVFLEKLQTQRKQRFQNSNTHSKWKNTHQIWWFTRKIEKMFLIHFQITRKLQSHIIDSKWQKENDEMWFLFGDYFLIYRVDVNGWLCRTMVSQLAILFRFFFLSLLSFHLFRCCRSFALFHLSIIVHWKWNWEGNVCFTHWIIRTLESTENRMDPFISDSREIDVIMRLYGQSSCSIYMCGWMRVRVCVCVCKQQTYLRT